VATSLRSAAKASKVLESVTLSRMAPTISSNNLHESVLVKIGSSYHAGQPRHVAGTRRLTG